ncbi:patatin-like phospholipase family protein [Croceimicrobium hydrocarbonivorans]|uniref:Patatin-like phospholipase family protein n=1 Tax=Croceimicrobium hydrocarbonivorans TaxID=2761580 RepID=A0A7H0VK21_9FLAO|nr:patatin-like phospholipase family protein [Croceimicrobium hydrocarbonivorans]
MENQKVHLVLASGGARGIAHIGVIERLEAAGNEIVEVAGCSMGAVVGGLYAAGKLKEYTEWLLELQRTDVFRQMDFTLARHGFVKGEKIFSTIMNLIGPQKIENLKVPFTAVATDLKTGEEVVFKKGDLYQAMRASVSIPGIFTPVSYEERKGHLLVDGGVVNPLPLNQIKAPEGHVVVAVDINATGPKPAIMKKDEEDQDRGWLNINLNFFKSNSGNQDPGLMDIISASYEHMQNQLILRDLATYKPEYLIRIPRSTCGVFDFHMAEDLIEVGRKAYDEQIIESNDAQSFAS